MVRSTSSSRYLGRTGVILLLSIPMFSFMAQDRSTEKRLVAAESVAALSLTLNAFAALSLSRRLRLPAFAHTFTETYMDHEITIRA